MNPTIANPVITKSRLQRIHFDGPNALNLPRYNEHLFLLLAVSKNDTMIKMVDKHDSYWSR